MSKQEWIAQMSRSQQTEFTVDAVSGILAPARQCPSPNHDDRPDGSVISMLIVHGISLPPGEFGGDHIEHFFCNRLDWNAHPYFAEIEGMEVSSHLLIRRDGSMVQFVPFTRRAWHAGQSSFRGETRCNDFSIGIELEGDDQLPYADEQYEALTGVSRALLNAYPGLSARTIAGHSDVSPDRKTDPGPVFDWLRLYDGLAISSTRNT